MTPLLPERSLHPHAYSYSSAYVGAAHLANAKPRCPAASSGAAPLSRPFNRNTATMLAVLGVGLAVGAPFVVGSHQSLAWLRTVSMQMFLVLAASAAVSALGKAGKQYLIQTALGLRLPFGRTYGIALVTDSAFLVSPLGAAGYGVNIGLLQRAGASWATATTIVGADQALDLAFLAVAVPIAIAFAVGPLAQVVPRPNVSMVVGMLAGVAILVATLWACRGKVASVVNAACGRIQWLGSQRARWDAFRQSVRRQAGLLMMGPRHRFAGLLVFTTLQWLPRYGVLWFVLLELGYRLPFGFVVAVQAVVLHAALWTGIPAGGAAGDLALAAAFANWIPQDAMAPALVLWRFATLYFPLILGAAAFFAFAWRRGSVRPTTE
ncbi:TPA: flippase-like domain-containing protein [Burkholderia vietnamiensis]|nr:flippase-like domain-containing protein [Burkholderia vietnamiensis]